jgi:hypothetical protein
VEAPTLLRGSSSSASQPLSSSIQASRSRSREALQARAKKVLEHAKQTLERTSKPSKRATKPVPTPIPTAQPTWVVQSASPVVIAGSSSSSPKVSTPPHAVQRSRSKSRRRSSNSQAKPSAVPHVRSMSKNRRHIITALEVRGLCYFLWGSRATALVRCDDVTAQPEAACKHGNTNSEPEKQSEAAAGDHGDAAPTFSAGSYVLSRPVTSVA